MNFEPLTSLTPFEPADPAVPSPALATSSPPPPSHYFDRTGWLWIVACVLFGTTTGQLLPKLAEPDGWRSTLASLGFDSVYLREATQTASASHPSQRASLPQQDGNPAQPTRAAQVKQEVEPLTGVVFRQF